VAGLLVFCIQSFVIASGAGKRDLCEGVAASWDTSDCSSYVQPRSKKIKSKIGGMAKSQSKRDAIKRLCSLLPVTRI
jgi:hypothetical protein